MAKSTAMTSFITNLDRIRRDRGLTQTDLAELLGTSQGNVSRLLGGGEDVTLTRCELIAKKLGVSLSEMIESPILSKT